MSFGRRHTSPRLDYDESSSGEEEQSVGLLHHHRLVHPDDQYPPPPSPPSPEWSPALSCPSRKGPGPRTTRTRIVRPFVGFSLALFLLVLVTVSLEHDLAYDQVISRWKTRYRPTTSSLDDDDARLPLQQRMHDAPSRELAPEGILRFEGSRPRGDPEDPSHLVAPETTVTAIVLHGLGQPNVEPPFVRALAARFPWVRWISPTADSLNVTVRNHEPTSAWFNIETFADLSTGENVDQFVHSQQQLNKLVDDEKALLARSGKEPRIVLMGFSQGAVMTILGVLSTDREDRYEAGIALSGYVPLEDDLSLLASPLARRTPLLWLHGREDPYLTAEKAKRGAQILRRRPISLEKLEFRIFSGLEHYWNEDELAYASDWFARTVPQTRPHQVVPPSPPQTRDAASTERLPMADVDFYDKSDQGPPSAVSRDRLKVRRLR
ncbi:hypothetical protein JCM10212_003763 [Sporobolomyces blumeae]